MAITAMTSTAESRTIASRMYEFEGLEIFIPTPVIADSVQIYIPFRIFWRMLFGDKEGMAQPMRRCRLPNATDKIGINTFTPYTLCFFLLFFVWLE